ncbi:MAG: hypothetical protein ACJ74Y_08880, partial [Bryobacteraceae bacterium]
RMLFNWLVTGQVVATSPAHAVRGPKHVVKTGKTTLLDADQARTLLDSIDVSTVVGLRDRALIALMLPWRWMSRTTSPRANVGGSACRRKAANVTSCQITIISRRISTPTSKQRASGKIKKVPSSARPTGALARSLATA